jgi:hypothetical protein
MFDWEPAIDRANPPCRRGSFYRESDPYSTSTFRRPGKKATMRELLEARAITSEGFCPEESASLALAWRIALRIKRRLPGTIYILAL